MWNGSQTWKENYPIVKLFIVTLNLVFELITFIGAFAMFFLHLFNNSVLFGPAVFYLFNYYEVPPKYSKLYHFYYKN